MVLKIDVDRTRKLSRRELERRARIAHVTIVRLVDTRSPSGRGWHRVLEVEWKGSGPRPVESSGREGDRARGDGGKNPPLPFSALEVVALQLLFGSDPIREAFNFHRARLVDSGEVSAFWRKRWNTFYATSGGR